MKTWLIWSAPHDEADITLWELVNTILAKSPLHAAEKYLGAGKFTKQAEQRFTNGIFDFIFDRSGFRIPGLL